MRKLLIAFTIMMMASAASAATIEINGQTYTSPKYDAVVQTVCSLGITGEERKFEITVDGVTYQATRFWTGQVFFGMSEQPWTCAERNPNRNVGGGSGGGYARTATEHQRDAGRDGKLDESKDEVVVESDGPTEKGETAPPMVVGNN